MCSCRTGSVFSPILWWRQLEHRDYSSCPIPCSKELARARKGQAGRTLGSLQPKCQNSSCICLFSTPPLLPQVCSFFLHWRPGTQKLSLATSFSLPSTSTSDQILPASSQRFSPVIHSTLVERPQQVRLTSLPHTPTRSLFSPPEAPS